MGVCDGSWGLRSNKGELEVTLDAPEARLTEWSASARYALGGEGRDEKLVFGAPAQGCGEATAIEARGALLAIRGALVLNGGRLHLQLVLSNESAEDLALDLLTLRIAKVQLGARAGRFSFFRNGYQSWTETRSYRPDERQMVSILPPMTVLQDDPRNQPAKQGEFTSEMFAVIANLDERAFLLVGQAATFRQFFHIKAAFDPRAGALRGIAISFDFGGQALMAGGRIELDEVVWIADVHANRVQDRYFDLIQVDGVDCRELPVGWCSWYYYYSKVREADLYENLAVARTHGVDWCFFVLDDGYERAVGDWLTANAKFPGGLGAVAERIRAQGMLPGLWLAPFVARGNSQLFREHPEWLLRTHSGSPAFAGWNPGWGLEGRFYGLDTTHPGFAEHLRRLIGTLVHTYGYRFLKLDFTYGASLPGVAHDRSLSAADRLSRGYRIVRESAGRDVFILGCGSPLAPARGWVDAMRIGPDVAPYWFANYRYYLTRDSNALCTLFAIRNVLNRCGMHRRLWINDPDCLLLRDAETKLTADERMSLANAAIVTGGMYMISDRLSRLPEGRWTAMAEIERLARQCDRGRAWALDCMERPIPELVYNSAGCLAVFNLEDRVVNKQRQLSEYLAGMLNMRARLSDVWNGERFSLADGSLDVGAMRPHSSRLLRIDA
jgi:alpha-galactosidase